MSLKEVLKEITDQKTIVNQDMTKVSMRARTYKVGQIQSAKTRLETLYVNYKNALLESAVFMLTTGDSATKFAEVGEKSFKCFSMDAKQFYKDIASEISPQLYLNKNLSSSLFDVLNNVIETKMENLDVISYNTVMFSSKYQRNVKSEEELIEVIKQAVNEQIGSEVIGLYALEKISRQAVNEEYHSRLVPIILHTDDEALVGDIHSNIKKMNSKAVVVTAGKTKLDNINPAFSLAKTTKDEVGKALKEIAANA